MANDNNIQPMADDSQIVLYQPDESISFQVKIEEDTVWLTQAQMVELFGSSKANISEHITNIYQQGELVQSATVRKFRTVRKEGYRMVTRNMENLRYDHRRKKADFMRRFKVSRERKAEYIAQMEKRMRDNYRRRTGKEAESFCVL